MALYKSWALTFLFVICISRFVDGLAMYVDSELILKRQLTSVTPNSEHFRKIIRFLQEMRAIVDKQKMSTMPLPWLHPIQTPKLGESSFFFHTPLSTLFLVLWLWTIFCESLHFHGNKKMRFFFEVSIVLKCWELKRIPIFTPTSVHRGKNVCLSPLPGNTKIAKNHHWKTSGFCQIVVPPLWTPSQGHVKVRLGFLKSFTPQVSPGEGHAPK